MPDDSNRPVAAAVGAVVLAYAVLIRSELLLGLVAASLLALVVRFGDRVAVDLDRRRWVVVNGLAVGAFAYLTVVGGDAPLLGIAVGALVVLLGWVTAPRGPLARAVRWVRDARDDLRAVRTAVEREDPADD